MSTCFPSWLHTAELNTSVCPDKTIPGVFLSKSQMRAVPSTDALRIRFPSGENDAAVSDAVCPSNVDSNALPASRSLASATQPRRIAGNRTSGKSFMAQVSFPRDASSRAPARRLASRASISRLCANDSACFAAILASSARRLASRSATTTPSSIGRSGRPVSVNPTQGALPHRRAREEPTGIDCWTARKNWSPLGVLTARPAPTPAPGGLARTSR